MGEGTLRGRLVDDKDQPVRDVVLAAVSVEREGKSARYGNRARAERDGTFSIVVPAAEGGTHYEIEVVSQTLPPGFDGLASRGKDTFLRAEPGRVVDVGKFALRAGPRDEPGAFTLVLRIVDERGGPVVGAVAVLSRNVRSPEGFGPRTWEAGGPTDAGGIARFTGEHVGSKHLSVEARTQGFRRLDRDMTLAVGAHDETIVLAPGLEIEGTLRDLEGHVVTTGTAPSGNGMDIQVYARGASARDEWIFASIDDNGRFLLRGLDDEEYQLEVQGGPWSPVCMTGVRAGKRDLALRLKLDDDPRDAGDHCAEIHARVVDASTRQPVPVDPENIEVEALPAGTTEAEVRTSFAASHQWERPVQKMWIGDVPATSDKVRRTGLEGGTYAFIVRASGYATAIVAPIQLAAHEVKSDVVIEVARPVEVTGRVLEKDGRPAAGAYVMLCGSGAQAEKTLEEADKDVRDTNGKPRTAMHGLFAVDADGRFRIGGVAPGLACSVVALHEHREPARSATMRTGKDASVEIRFDRAR
jgi:hypothetical protein